MPKRRGSYLLLSVAAAGVATLPACSGTVSMEGSSGASGSAGSSSVAGATSIVVSEGGYFMGSLPTPPGGGTGGGPCGGGPCGAIIEPAGGAAGEIDSGGALNQGGGGPCGGNFCGSLVTPPGAAGEAGATNP